MGYYKVVVAIHVNAENQQDAIDVVDSALTDVLFDYDERLRSRYIQWVEDQPTDDDDAEGAENND